MTSYKMKVYFERIYEVEAENLEEAKEKALDKVEPYNVFKVGGLMAEQYIEPTNWDDDAEEMGKDIADDLESPILEEVEAYIATNGDTGAWGEDMNDGVAVDTIFEVIDREHDIYNRAYEYADGHFIYMSTDAINEARDCINELHRWEETDSGLWEGEDDVDMIINKKATYTLGNALLHYAEEKIRERIEELLNEKYNQK